jgi:hypothetical protein
MITFKIIISTRPTKVTHLIIRLIIIIIAADQPSRSSAKFVRSSYGRPQTDCQYNQVHKFQRKSQMGGTRTLVLPKLLPPKGENYL